MRRSVRANSIDDLMMFVRQQSCLEGILHTCGYLNISIYEQMPSRLVVFNSVDVRSWLRFLGASFGQAETCHWLPFFNFDA